MGSRISSDDAPNARSDSNSQLHQTTFISDEAYKLHIETHGGVVLRFLVELRRRKVFVHAASFEVLVRMLEVLDEDALRQHRFVARVSQGYLCEATGRIPSTGTRGHIARLLQELVAAKIITCIENGTSTSASSYELHLPKEATDRSNPFPVKRSSKKGRCARDSTQRARALVPNNPITRAGAGNQRAPEVVPDGTLARAGACNQRAPALGGGTITGATPPPDTTEVFSSSSPAVEEEERRADAAASVLAEFGFGDEAVLQILNLPTATLLVVRAACEEATHKPLGQRFGLARSLIKKPGNISPHILDRVRRQIEDARVKPFDGMIEPAKVARQIDAATSQFRSAQPEDPRELRRAKLAELKALPDEQLAGLIDRLIEQVPADNHFLRNLYEGKRFVALNFAPMVDALHDQLTRERSAAAAEVGGQP